MLNGTVVAAHGRQYLVELGTGETLLCFPRGKKSELACGDHVHLQRSGDNQGMAAFAGGRLTVARFNLEWLTDGKTTQP